MLCIFECFWEICVCVCVGVHAKKGRKRPLLKTIQDVSTYIHRYTNTQLFETVDFKK